MGTYQQGSSVVQFPQRLNWQSCEVTSLIDREEGTIFRAEIFNDGRCGASWMLCAHRDDMAVVLTSGSANSLHAAKEDIWRELKNRVSKASFEAFAG